MMRLARLSLLMVGSIVAARLLWVASTAPSWGAGDVKPVPQDHAKIKEQFEERLAWNRKTLGEAYETVGKKNPKWDEPALKALDVAARAFSQQFDPLVLISAAHEPARQAVDAGCDDPLILYIYSRSATGESDLEEEAYRKRIEDVAKKLQESEYPTLRKTAALLWAASLKATDSATMQQKAEAQKQIDLMLELASKGARKEPIPNALERYWYDALNAALSVRRQLEPDTLKALESVEKKIADARELQPIWLSVKGNCLYMWAWEARGQRFAVAVTREQFRTFDQRVAEAQKTLEEAWRLKPETYQVATLMVDLEKAVGGGDRAEMEKWFDRAMTADGNDREACWSKMDWLDPKWHGDGFEDMIAFGRACAATKNWQVGITLLAADTHFRYAVRGPVKNASDYLSKPDVWSEIEPVFEEFLEHFPSNTRQRSKYAALCAVAGRWSKAHKQFEILGDNLRTWPDTPNLPLDVLKRLREIAKIKGK